MTGAPSLRAWRILDGAIHEVALRAHRRRWRRDPGVAPDGRSGPADLARSAHRARSGRRRPGRRRRSRLERDGDLLDAIVSPPPLLRAALVGGSAALGVVLLGRSLGRLAEAGRDDVPALVRAVRLAFLAVAAFAATAGWALAHPLPLDRRGGHRRHRRHRDVVPAPRRRCPDAPRGRRLTLAPSRNGWFEHP